MTGPSRRRFIAKTLPALGITACGGGGPGARDETTVAAAAKLPNIVFILIDDQRNDTLGCAGHPVIRTPQIDTLAAEGTRFRNAFVTTSICAASRASIFTGLYERTHGYTFQAAPLADELVAESYPERLRRAGYRMGFIGKFGIEVTPMALTRMFDTFLPINRTPYWQTLPDGSKIHETDLIAQRAIEFLEKQSEAAPYCLNLSFNAVHAEDGDLENLYPWPPSSDGLYDGVEIPAPRLSSPEIFNAMPDFLKSSENRARFFWCCDATDKYQRNMRAYYRMISGVDSAIGRILSALRRLKLDDNTVVIYAADNGYYMGDRGFSGKWSHFEQSLRIPLIVRDPRLPASAKGRVVDAMALNIDISATLHDFAGLTSPSRQQGRSLRAMLQPGAASDAATAARTDFLCEHLWSTPTIPRWEGVRDTRYVYARYFGVSPAYEFLHDLQTDPDELVNLARDPAQQDVLNRMRTRCASLVAAAQASRPVKI